MKLSNRLSLLLTTLLLGSIVLPAQEKSLTFRWQGKVSADKIVEIKNINGAIDADGVAGDEIKVTAEKSGPRASEVKIEVVPHGEGVTICAIYPSGMFEGSSDRCAPGNKTYSSNVHDDETQVHFIVHLPKNLRFSGQTVNGNVTAQHLGRCVRAQSVNGAIVVSTAAWAQADTVNGDIKLSMRDPSWAGGLSIASVNGAVEIEMPEDLSADVKFGSVNGQMKSEFPLTINDGFPVGNSAHGTAGKGGRSLSVHTVNGDVTLKKSHNVL